MQPISTYGAASVTATDTSRMRSLTASVCNKMVVADLVSRCKATTLSVLPIYPNKHKIPPHTPQITKLNSAQSGSMSTVDDITAAIVTSRR